MLTIVSIVEVRFRFLTLRVTCVGDVFSAEVGEQTEEQAYFEALLMRVAEGLGWLDPVVVATSVSLMAQVAGGFEISHDALCRPFGDVGHGSNVADTEVGVLCDHDKDARMTSKEGPRPVLVVTCAAHCPSHRTLLIS